MGPRVAMLPAGDTALAHALPGIRFTVAREQRLCNTELAALAREYLAGFTLLPKERISFDFDPTSERARMMASMALISR